MIPTPETATPATASNGSTSIWPAVQLLLAIAIAVAALVYLLRPKSGSGEGGPPPPKPDPVHVAGPYLIAIEPGTGLGDKLQTVVLQRRMFSAPALTATGTVVASLRPGDSAAGHLQIAMAAIGGQATGLQVYGDRQIHRAALAAVGGASAAVGQAQQASRSDFWQFNSPEVLTAFTDWQKAIADIAFSERQLISIRDLARDREQSQQKVVEQMRKLVEGGTESQKALAVEETNLRQFRIQGRKDIYEAETAIKVARRNEAALSRQLQLAGLDPELLRAATSDVDIVMADVPEGKLMRVRVGASCTARFFGIPGQVFSGKVTSIAPVVTKEARTLRVLFAIDDLNDQLRPGMFAEIGVDTEPRLTLLAPADGILHVGRSDYALISEKEGLWRVVEVVVGESHGQLVEILGGLQPGERMMGRGAILLKPLVVTAIGDAGSKSAVEGAR